MQSDGRTAHLLRGKQVKVRGRFASLTRVAENRPVRRRSLSSSVISRLSWIRSSGDDDATAFGPRIPTCSRALGRKVLGRRLRAQPSQGFGRNFFGKIVRKFSCPWFASTVVEKKMSEGGRPAKRRAKVGGHLQRQTEASALDRHCHGYRLPLSTRTTVGNRR